jgi:hypothetical protein
MIGKKKFSTASGYIHIPPAARRRSRVPFLIRLKNMRGACYNIWRNIPFSYHPEGHRD